jgi:hypothetical protein
MSADSSPNLNESQWTTCNLRCSSQPILMQFGDVAGIVVISSLFTSAAVESAAAADLNAAAASESAKAASEQAASEAAAAEATKNHAAAAEAWDAAASKEENAQAKSADADAQEEKADEEVDSAADEKADAEAKQEQANEDKEDAAQKSGKADEESKEATKDATAANALEATAAAQTASSSGACIAGTYLALQSVQNLMYMNALQIWAAFVAVLGVYVMWGIAFMHNIWYWFGGGQAEAERNQQERERDDGKGDALAHGAAIGAGFGILVAVLGFGILVAARFDDWKESRLQVNPNYGRANLFLQATIVAASTGLGWLFVKIMWDIRAEEETMSLRQFWRWLSTNDGYFGPASLVTLRAMAFHECWFVVVLAMWFSITCPKTMEAGIAAIKNLQDARASGDADKVAVANHVIFEGMAGFALIVAVAVVATFALNFQYARSLAEERIEGPGEQEEGAAGEQDAAERNHPGGHLAGDEDEESSGDEEYASSSHATAHRVVMHALFSVMYLCLVIPACAFALDSLFDAPGELVKDIEEGIFHLKLGGIPGTLSTAVQDAEDDIELALKQGPVWTAICMASAQVLCALMIVASQFSSGQMGLGKRHSAIRVISSFFGMLLRTWLATLLLTILCLLFVTELGLVARWLSSIPANFWNATGFSSLVASMAIAFCWPDKTMPSLVRSTNLNSGGDDDEGSSLTCIAIVKEPYYQTMPRLLSVPNDSGRGQRPGKYAKVEDDDQPKFSWYQPIDTEVGRHQEELPLATARRMADQGERRGRGFLSVSSSNSV